MGSLARRYRRRKLRKQSKWQPGVEKLKFSPQPFVPEIPNCEHGRPGGFACPHCHGFAFGDRPREGSFKLIDKDGNEIGGGEFTADGEVGKIYRTPEDDEPNVN